MMFSSYVSRRIAITATIFISLIACSGEKKSEDEDDGNVAGPTSSGKTGSLAISGIDTFPYATEAVITSATLTDEQAAEAETFDSPTAGTLAIGDLQLLADEGIPLGESTSSTLFSSSSNASYGACEMVNRGRGFLHEAAAGDAIQCEIGLMSLLPSLSELYDGQAHIIKEEDDDGVMLMKVQIEGTKENIVGFTVHACEDGEQSVYLKSRVDPATNAYTFIGKRQGRPDNPQVDRYYADIRVSGQVDDDGSFVGLKTIDNTSSNEFSSGGVSFNRYQIVQSAKNILFQGVQQQTDRPSPDRFVSFFELIDGNTADAPFELGKLAIGDGGIAIASDGDNAIVQGWRGDSRLIDGTAPQVEKIRGHKDDLPVATEPEAIVFTGDESWDCSDEGAITITEEEFVAEGITDDDFDRCEGFSLPQNDHLECHQIASKASSD